MVTVTKVDDDKRTRRQTTGIRPKDKRISDANHYCNDDNQYVSDTTNTTTMALLSVTRQQGLKLYSVKYHVVNYCFPFEVSVILNGCF